MANLIKYRPLTDLFNWEPVWDRLFDDVPLLKRNAPAVDVREDEKEYTMEVELPGLTEKDIDVKVENNILTVSSKKEESKEEEKKGYLMHERKSYSFTRSFVLPDEVNHDKISAEFKNGLLRLALPKNEKAQPKKIDVKAN